MDEFENGFAAQKAPELTLDPFGTAQAAQESAPEIPAIDTAAAEPDYEKMLTPEELEKVEEFSKSIDIRNSSMVMQYGAAAQQKVAELSDSALENVRTKDFGEVGEMLAETLKRPFVTDVVEVEPADAKVVVKKELESGYLKVESPIPSVFTIAKPNYDPRYPSVKSKIAARRAKIPTVAQSELALEDGALKARVSHKAFLEPPKQADAATAVAKALEILAADKVL